MQPANFESTIQGEMKWLKLKMVTFRPGEMNAWGSKLFSDSNVLVMKVTESIYFYKYGNLGAALESRVQLSENWERVNIVQQLNKWGKLNMPVEINNC